jgi:hypothetical protein
MQEEDDHSPLAADPKRDASPSIRGYYVQIWRSVLAWTKLGANETLFLEGAEDFDKVTADSAETVQVKDVKGSITLRSKDVADAISNFFEHKARNRDRSIRFRFVTIGTIGKEDGDPLGAGVRGLEMWQQTQAMTGAAERAANARAIAKFLIDDGRVRASAKEAIENTADADLFAVLIEPIQWDTDAPTAGDVERDVKDWLVNHGSTRNVPVYHSEAVADHLYREALTVATREKHRSLTSAGLLRVFEERTMMPVPIGEYTLFRASREQSKFGGQESVSLQIAAPTGAGGTSQEQSATLGSTILADPVPQQGETPAPDEGQRALAAALERDLAARYQQAVERQSFPNRGRQDEFAPLAEEVLSPRYTNLSAELRKTVLLRASRSASIRMNVADAARFLDEARRINRPEPESVAVARLQFAQGDAEASLRTLRDTRTPDARAALLSIVIRHNGDQAALDWLSINGLGVSELAGIGIVSLFQIHLRRRDWDSLTAMFDRVTDDQCRECPYLRQLRAVFRLSLVIPKSNRVKLLLGVALDVRFATLNVPEAEARRLLNQALDDFGIVFSRLEDLDLEIDRRLVGIYATWCRLLHPDLAPAARQKLANDMKDPRTAALNVQFAFAYLEDFTPDDLMASLRRREELGGLDDDDLRGALSIRLHSPDFQETVSFLTRYRGRLIADYGEAYIASLEVEARLSAGDVTSAKLRFDEQKSLFDPENRAMLETEIATAEGADPVTAQKRLYEETGTVGALQLLVSALVERKDYAGLAPYAEALYRETGKAGDLNLAIRAYDRGGDVQAFLRLLAEAPDQANSDPQVGIRQAGYLLRNGRVKEARELAGQLRAAAPGALDVELAAAVEIGDWEDVGRIAGEYLKRPADHSAPALMNIARAAHAASQGNPMALVAEAVAMAPGDPNILLGAYLLATNDAGEENKSRMMDWFNRAVELSGTSGPIQKVEIKQVLEQGTAWAQQTSNISRKVLNGEVPLFVAAPGLRGNLVEMLLRNLLNNSAQTDPRRMAPLPLFSGRRLPQRVPKTGRLAFDITGLLVLAWLGHLKKALEIPERIFLPAGLMTELFEARGELRQFQSTRIRRAQEIQDAVSRGRLKVVRASGIEDILNDTLDDELADLMRSARAEDGSVVRPAPVHRRGSLNENIDPTPFLDRFADLRELLALLAQGGTVDQQTEGEAARFFELQDEGWPGNRRPIVGKPLFLDSLAVAHLQTAGLLGAVLNAFQDVYVHDRVATEAAAVIEHDKRATEMIRVIDEVKSLLSSANQQGRVDFGSESDRSGKEDFDASSVFLLTDLGGIDGIIVDDRFMNQEQYATDIGGQSAPTFSSLDILEELLARGAIAEGDHRISRHRLRRAGATLMPVNVAEIVNAASRNRDAESAEFRAIRNTISLSRVGDIPQFPAEIPWFNALSQATKRALIEIWDQAPEESVESQADAVLDLRPIPEDWAGAWHGSAPPGWIDAVAAAMVHTLAFPAELGRRERIVAYNEWIERRVLRRLRALSPGRYATVVSHLRALIRSLKDEVDGGADTAE